MTQIIHCADLHLSMTDREYGLAVLDEILDLARGADALIMAGDLFDSFQDLESLRADFRKRMGTLPGHCKPIVIAGNHERLGRRSPLGESSWRRWRSSLSRIVLSTPGTSPGLSLLGPSPIV